ncbi:MAG: hypothetical protein QM784_28285 [Polyangiaceae bacterium]
MRRKLDEVTFRGLRASSMCRQGVDRHFPRFAHLSAALTGEYHRDFPSVACRPKCVLFRRWSSLNAIVALFGVQPPRVKVEFEHFDVVARCELP